MAQYNSHAYLRPTRDQLPAVFKLFLLKYSNRKIKTKKALADVLDKTMRATALEAVKIASRLAPKDTGALRNSITEKKVGPVRYLVGSNLVYAAAMEYFDLGPGGYKSKRRSGKRRYRRGYKRRK